MNATTNASNPGLPPTEVRRPGPSSLALLIVLSAIGSVFGGNDRSGASATGAPAALPASDWSGIRAAYEAGRLQIVEQSDGHHTARNPGQAWHTRFDGRGFHVEPAAADWRWGLALRAYDAGEGHRVQLRAPASVTAEANRLATRWDDVLSEWFVNGSNGLEQGWTIARNPVPSADTPLRLELGVTGGLAARVSSDGKQVTFANGSGPAVVTYAGLRAWDADGRDVPVRFAALESRSSSATTGRFAVEVDTRGGRYPLTIDPVAQQAYVKASNTDAGDLFGRSVAISGDTVVVGAPGEDGDGIAASGTSDGTNGDPTDNSIATAGAAYVFVRSGGGWAQQAYLKGVVYPFIAPAVNDGFGASVAIVGDTIVVGASGKTSNKGAAFVFTRSGGSWSAAPVRLLAYPTPDESGSFGLSVGISGDTIVVGAIDSPAPGSYIGRACVFVRTGTNWSLQANLQASNPESLDAFGSSVAISGETLVVGAPNEGSSETGTEGTGANNNSPQSGAAYVFIRAGGFWSQQAYVKASNTGQYDRFGTSVALEGNTLVVGANLEGSATQEVNGDQSDNSQLGNGAAYVFERNGDSWRQTTYLKAFERSVHSGFGGSVGLSGNRIVVGAPYETGEFGESGAAYTFERTGASWKPFASLRASHPDASDDFSSSVAISGNTVVVGARAEDSIRVGINGNETDNSAADAGAAYIFTLTPPPSVRGTAAPAVRVKGKKTLRTTAARVVIKGTATDPDADLTRVEVKVGKAKWKKARGLEKWRFVVRGLKLGRTKIKVRALDATGRYSSPVKLTIFHR